MSQWYKESRLSDNPIAQTFRILPEHCADADGLYLTSCDLFFQAKDTTSGITVQIRECLNGTPTRTVLATTHLLAKNIKISNNGLIPTRCIFDIPAFLKSGKQYALSVSPDGGSPDIKLWYLKTGEDDIVTGAPISSSWGDGTLFISASSAWSPIVDSDLKFRLNKATFKPTVQGEIVQVNEDLEFLTIENLSGTIQLAEEVYKVPSAFAAGTVTCTKGSSSVTGVSTTFTSSFSSGDSIVIRSSSNNDISDVVTVKSIASDTSMTIVGGARIGIASANAAKTPTGIIGKYDTVVGNKVTIKESSASGSNLFANGDTIKCTESAASFDIASIDNSIVNHYQPHLYKTETTGTTLFSTIKTIDSTTPATNETRPLIYGVTNRNTSFNSAVFSKSNEVRDNSGNKSLVVTTKLKTTNDNVSPTLDTKEGMSMIEAYATSINNIDTNERIYGQGLTTSKYVSKTVTLASGMEAEDLNTYVTGYRPAGTSLDVYAMFTSPGDDDKMIDRQWTKLNLAEGQTELFSASDAANDFKEFKYTVPAIPTIENTNRQSGVATCSVGSTTISGSGANNTNYAAGDLMIITDGIPDNYVLGRVESSNTTAVVFTSAADKAFTSTLHYKVNADEKQAAFLYPQSDGSFKLRYFDSTGREYENFGLFQVKVLFRSDKQYKVPKIADIRAIALSA
tara:strand:+ start:1191 stop:3233 length:2043 start_codon:yes stop_codon:yes gene_type:complete